LQDNEALFELDVNAATNDWWVEESASGNRILERDLQLENQCHGKDNCFSRTRHCLPSSECYTFIAGDELINDEAFYFTDFNVTFDGELVATSQHGSQFDAIEFGNGCSKLGFRCKNEDEALFELFAFHGNDVPDVSF